MHFYKQLPEKGFWSTRLQTVNEKGVRQLRSKVRQFLIENSTIFDQKFEILIEILKSFTEILLTRTDLTECVRNKIWRKQDAYFESILTIFDLCSVYEAAGAVYSKKIGLILKPNAQIKLSLCKCQNTYWRLVGTLYTVPVTQS